MSAEESAAVPPRRRRQTTLACYTCRRKHLKCDGTMPVCTRCTATASRCTYLPSRRGLAGRPQHQQHELSAAALTPRQSITTSPAHPGNDEATNMNTVADDQHPESSPIFTAAERKHYIGLYYARFHASHPMLVPLAYFEAQQYPDFLIIATCLVGQYYTSSRPTEASLSDAVSMIVDADDADSIRRTQAFTLLALVFLGGNQTTHVSDCLGRATLLAYESRLDSLDLLPASNCMSSIKRESLRRTWWELYTIDALSALLQGRHPKLDTRCPGSLPAVPCTEAQYETGEPGVQPSSYADFQRRVFLPNSSPFPSHFYRIEAVGIIRTVLPLYMRDNADVHDVEASTNAIASWKYHLSETTFPLSDSILEWDHVLIQAHLLVQVASIFLHFPRSNLPSSKPSAVDTTCLSKGPQVMEHSVQNPRARLHTAQAIAASQEICNMASVPHLQDGHSPLAICAFLLGSAVQLSAASKYDKTQLDQIQQCRHRVVLLLGTLKSIGKTWPSVLGAVHFIGPFADRLFWASTDNKTRPDNALAGTDARAAPASFGSGTGGDQQDYAALADSTLFENTFDMEWFNFFSSIEGTTNL